MKTPWRTRPQAWLSARFISFRACSRQDIADAIMTGYSASPSGHERLLGEAATYSQVGRYRSRILIKRCGVNNWRSMPATPLESSHDRST